MRLLLSRPAIAACAFAVFYVLVWFVVYSVLMEFDYRYMPEYFRLGWRGGGELPAIIQLASIAISLIAAVIVGVVYRLRAGRSKAKSL